MRNQSAHGEKVVTAPYGTWKSPVSARSVSSGNHVFELNLYGEDLYFVEVRPREEHARYSVMRIKGASGTAAELTPAPFNARTTVHEYGGGGFVIAADSLIFSNFSDQRLYRKNLNSSDRPSLLTAGGTDSRYADGVYDESRNRIICVRELHPILGQRDAINSIVSIDPVQGKERQLLSGNDFYAYPRLNPDRSKFAWITWNFPNMPFDGSELWVGEFDSEGSVENKVKLAGGLDESVTQPRWSDSGELYFISDRNGWWNLYRWNSANGTSEVCPKEADFCEPDWNLGLSTFAFESEDGIICTFAEKGEWKLARIDLATSQIETIDSPFTAINYIHSKGNRFVVFLAGSPKKSSAIYRFDFATKKLEKVYESPGENEEKEIPASPPEFKPFQTSNNLTAHGFYYEPLNPEYSAPENELPPLVVMVHGGPTHASTNVQRGTIQFFTSRGFAVLDVNYGGSSAFGREYRRRLNGQWGVVDVDDCINGAKSLAAEGKIDSNRVVIRGGSAGGWTTLAALAFSDYFKAGACYYGISDLERWELNCHKFESQYLHSLIGSYPQERELFVDRSPTSHADKFSAPLIVFQGLEDRVVPPSQSQLIVDALKKRNKVVEYHPFEDEQHDFRQTVHIEKALELELDFFRKALKI